MNAEYIELYGPWGEHPAHPLDLWKYEVANDDTRLGYWAWVEVRATTMRPGSSARQRH